MRALTRLPLALLAAALSPACGDPPDTSGFPDELPADTRDDTTAPDTADTSIPIDTADTSIDTADTSIDTADTSIPIDTADTSVPIDTADTSVPIDTADTSVPVDAEVTPTCDGLCPRVVVGPTGIKLTTHEPSARPTVLRGLVGALRLPTGPLELVSVDVYQFGVFPANTSIAVTDRGSFGGVALTRDMIGVDVTLHAVVRVVVSGTTVATQDLDNRTLGGGCYTLADNVMGADLTTCPPYEPEDLGDKWAFEYSTLGGLITESRIDLPSPAAAPIIVHQRFAPP